MKRPGRDPTRRNRNIGTKKQGHGDDNRNVVPRLWRESVWEWRRTPGSSVVHRMVWGRDMPFLVEPTREDCWYACTIDDVARMLNLLPKRHINNCRDVSGVQGIIFRQPTHKEEQLAGVWGRIGYAVEVGRAIGPVIQLTANPAPFRRKWSRHLGPVDRRELERLQRASTTHTSDGRHHRLEFDLDAIRRVQLFFTLPHEVGHWADMYENVEIPTLDADFDFGVWQEAWDRYFQRPNEQREEFANRYAEAAIARLTESGQVPYPRIFDLDQLNEDGLRREDFLPDSEITEA
ncbi:MAG: hypothetical protein CMJ83_08690 [Planctomycetes bacterium]|nr:hypothetical protein [Planctomycetota bacterium]